MVPSYMSVKCTRRTLRRKFHVRTAHITIPKYYSQVGLKFRRADPLTQDKPTWTKFSHFPQKSKYQTYTLFDIHVNSNNIFPTDKMKVMLTLVGLPQRSQP